MSYSIFKEGIWTCYFRRNDKKVNLLDDEIKEDNNKNNDFKEKKGSIEAKLKDCSHIKWVAENRDYRAEIELSEIYHGEKMRASVEVARLPEDGREIVLQNIKERYELEFDGLHSKRFSTLYSDGLKKKIEAQYFQIDILAVEKEEQLKNANKQKTS
jgi:hypothetical protein